MACIMISRRTTAEIFEVLKERLQMAEWEGQLLILDSPRAGGG